MSLSLQTGRKITWTYQFYFIPLKKKIKMKIQSYRLRENEATFSYGLKESRPSCKGPLAQLASGT